MLALASVKLTSSSAVRFSNVNETSVDIPLIDAKVTGILTIPTVSLTVISPLSKATNALLSSNSGIVFISQEAKKTSIDIVKKLNIFLIVLSVKILIPTVLY